MTDRFAVARAAGVLRRMTARGRDERHRVSTPLELFFDLCIVVAVAQAGGQLRHAFAEGHAASGVLGYALVFFGVWWAWMNFTWFASAYDVDDVPYRLLTLVQMAGAQVYAAGVPRAFQHGDWSVAVIGYVIMRLAMTVQWVRAARSGNGRERGVALTYAVGLLVCQAGWVGMVFAPSGVRMWLFALLVVAELAVPVVAERSAQTPWHPHHIAERYGLFTIIVLGETVSAGTIAVQTGSDEHDALGALLPVAGGGLVLVFAAWWIYFAVPVHGRLRTNRQAIPWGYGHYVIFGSAAAIGAGLEVSVERATGAAHLSLTAANAAVTVPAALYLVTVWLLHARHAKRTLAQHLVLPVAAVLLLAVTVTGRAAIPLAGLVAVLAVGVGLTLSARTPEVRPAGG